MLLPPIWFRACLSISKASNNQLTHDYTLLPENILLAYRGQLRLRDSARALTMTDFIPMSYIPDEPITGLDQAGPASVYTAISYCIEMCIETYLQWL